MFFPDLSFTQDPRGLASVGVVATLIFLGAESRPNHLGRPLENGNAVQAVPGVALVVQDIL